MKFNALKKGLDILNLYYARSWELQAKLLASEDCSEDIGYKVPM